MKFSALLASLVVALPYVLAAGDSGSELGIRYDTHRIRRPSVSRFSRQSPPQITEQIIQSIFAECEQGSTVSCIIGPVEHISIVSLIVYITITLTLNARPSVRPSVCLSISRMRDVHIPQHDECVKSGAAELGFKKFNQTKWVSVRAYNRAALWGEEGRNWFHLKNTVQDDGVHWRYVLQCSTTSHLQCC